MCEENED
jgi:hypothetical protein